MTADLFLYSLHLADNAVILAQRNSEWTAHGPVLEQDIAITNIALDSLGQARNFYQYAADIYNNAPAMDQQEMDRWLPRPWKDFNRELQEDDLAFLREERQFLNVQLVELPKGDWALTVLRQFFTSAFQMLQYTALMQSGDAQLAGIAEKSVKEVAYHLRWSGEWVIRLGDGTEESNRRMVSALQNLWSFTGELFIPAHFETTLAAEGIAPDPSSLKDAWMEKIASVFAEGTLEVPAKGWSQGGGKNGVHTEYIGYLLAEMQYLQRSYPNSTW